ncbi:MAG: SpvB/TcaC N-terminal domain-containing protein [Myxococcota bacterium]
MFALVVSRQSEGTGPWWVDVTAYVADGAPLTRRVHLRTDYVEDRGGRNGRSTSGLDPEIERALFGLEGDEATGTITREHGGEIKLGERVKLTAPGNAVRTDQELKVRRPSSVGLARLNPGMINVTAPRGGGYQFLPHGARFETPITISIPYDPTLIPRGMGPSDVRTYYYDEQGAEYLPLERVMVDPNEYLVVSLTDHFTDMINAVIVKPEGPSPQSFNSNAISGAATADPLAGMTLVAPPRARSDGTAVVDYPFVLPAGRGNYQPTLGLTYSSEAKHGIAGEGWSLTLSSIEIDTRFGSPRYETEPLDLDTNVVGERYLWSGQALVPVAEPAFLTSVKMCSKGGAATSQVFRLRKEGPFALIVRCGADHTSYYWEVTHKDGTRFTYGSRLDSRVLDPARANDPNGSGGAVINADGGVSFPDGRITWPAEGVACPADGRNIGKWLLEEVADTHGNVTDYSYSVEEANAWDSYDGTHVPCCVGESCPPQGTAYYVSRRLRSIQYTRAVGVAPVYSVDLEYQRRDGQGVADVDVSGRLGFKVVEDRRLSAVKVRCLVPECGQEPVREYGFEYDPPREANGYRTLLTAIRSCPDVGCTADAEAAGLVHTTRFGYTPFERRLGPAETEEEGAELWRLPDFDTMPLSGGVNAGFTEILGGGVYLAGAGNVVNSNAHTGAGATLSMFTDINGDGLPDHVVKTSPDTWFSGMTLIAYNTGRPDGDGRPAFTPVAPPNDPTLMRVVNVPLPLGIDVSQSFSLSDVTTVGLPGSAATASVRGGGSATLSASVAFPIDVDGDGLLDFVHGPVTHLQRRVLPSPVTPEEIIRFEPENIPFSTGTCSRSATVPSDVSTDIPRLELPRNVKGLMDAVQTRNPTYRWVAPQDGTVQIDVDAFTFTACDPSVPDDEKPQLEVVILTGPVRPPTPDPQQPIPLPETLSSLASIENLPSSFATDIEALFANPPAAPVVSPPLALDMFPQHWSARPEVARGAEVIARIRPGRGCGDGFSSTQNDLVSLDLRIQYVGAEQVETLGPLAPTDGVFDVDQDFRASGGATPLILPLSGRAAVSGTVATWPELSAELDVRLVKLSCAAATVPDWEQPTQFPWNNDGSAFPPPEKFTLPATPEEFASASRELFAEILTRCDKVTLRRACKDATGNFTDQLDGCEPMGPGQIWSFDWEGEVRASDQVILVVNGSSPYDPAHVSVSGPNLAYLGEDLTHGLTAPNEPPTTRAPPLSAAGRKVYSVPVAVEWNRWAPQNGRFAVPVSLGGASSRIHVTALGVPATWLVSHDATPEEREQAAHLLIQSRGGLVKRVALEQMRPPALCPQFDHKACNEPADPTKLECHPRSCIDPFGPRPDHPWVPCPDEPPVASVCFTRHDPCADCAGPGDCIWPADIPDNPEACKKDLWPPPPACAGEEGENPACLPGDGQCFSLARCVENLRCIRPECAVAAPLELMGEAGWLKCVPPGWDQCGLDNHCEVCPPPGVPIPRGCDNLWPDCPQVEESEWPFPFPFAPVDQYVDFEGALGDQVWVSIEPPRRALMAHVPPGWDPVATAERLLAWGDPAQQLQWIETQVYLKAINRDLRIQLEQGSGGPTRVEYTVLAPENTHDQPLPLELESPHAHFLARSFRGWSYGTWSGPGPAAAANPELWRPSTPGDAMTALASALTAGGASVDALLKLGIDGHPRKPVNAQTISSLAAPPSVEATIAQQNAAFQTLLEHFDSAPRVQPVRPGLGLRTGRYEGGCEDVFIQGGMVGAGRCVGDITTGLASLGAARDSWAFDVDVKETTTQLYAPCPLAVPRISLTLGANAGASVTPMVGANLNGSLTVPLVDYRDMNGDGIPDHIVLVPFTGDRPVPTALVFRRERRSERGPLAQPYRVSHTALGGTGMSGAMGVSASLQSPPLGGYLGAGGGINEGGAAGTLSDINGDGLPDIVVVVPDSATCPWRVHLNYGYRFRAEGECWKVPPLTAAAAMRRPPVGDLPPNYGSRPTVTQTTSVNGSLGMTASAAGFLSASAHVALGGAHSAQFIDFVDVNGDGLVDRVQMESDHLLKVNLNTGWGFAPAMEFQTKGWDAAIQARGYEVEPVLPRHLATAGGEFKLSGPNSVDSVLPGFLGAFATGLTTDLNSLAVADRHAGLTSSTSLNLSAGVNFDATPLYFTVASGVEASAGIEWQEGLFVDINGDGTPDLVRRALFSPRTAGLFVLPNRSGEGNRLNLVVNPLEGEIELTYERVGNTRDLPQSRVVLASVVERSKVDNAVASAELDGDPKLTTGTDIPSDVAVRFTYKGGRYDRANREFLGFSHVATEEIQPPAGHTKPDGQVLRTTCEEYWRPGNGQDYEVSGLLRRRTLSAGSARDSMCDEGSVRLSETRYAYVALTQLQPEWNPTTLGPALCPRPAPLPDDACRSRAYVLESVRSEEYEGTHVSSRTGETYRAYDDRGNVTEYVDEQDLDDRNDNLVVAVAYEDLATRYLAALPRDIQVYGSSGRPPALRHRSATYDLITGKPNTISYHGEQTLTTSYTYDTYGNVEQITDVQTGYVVHVEHGTAEIPDPTHSFVTKVWDELGQRTKRTYDFRFGVVKEERDANSNETDPKDRIRYDYDARGRLKSVYPPNGHEAVALYFSGRSATATTRGVPRDRGLVVTTVVDGLGRIHHRMRTSPADDTKLVYTDLRRWDEFGRLRLQGLAQPEPSVGAPAPTLPRAPRRTDYDVKGRVSRTLEPAGRRDGSPARDTAFTYSATTLDGLPRLLRTVIIEARDPLTLDVITGAQAADRASASIVEVARERVLAMIEFPLGRAADVQRMTKYFYDPLGQLERIDDAAGNVTRFMYDSLGRQTAVTAPDTGTTSYHYDAKGRLDFKQDARGVRGRVTYGYEDNSSRVVSITRGTESRPAFTFTYGRDNDADRARRAVGRVWSTTHDDGRDELTFDALGNVTETKRIVSASESYTLNQVYDALGRVRSITFPEEPSGGRNRLSRRRTKVDYEYNRAGLVTRAHVGGTDYAQVSYTIEGLRSRLTFASGATQDLFHDDRTLRVYSMRTARYQRSTGNRGGGSPIPPPSCGELVCPPDVNDPQPPSVTRYQGATLTYDVMGNVLSISNSTDDPDLTTDSRASLGKGKVPKSFVQTFQYDKLDRLTQAEGTLTYEDGQTNRYFSLFRHDDIHSMTHKEQNAWAEGENAPPIQGQSHTWDYEYDAGTPHRLSALRTPDGGIYASYAYDQAGQQLKSVEGGLTRHYRWTADGALQWVAHDLSGNDRIGSYAYNASGDRVAKTVGRDVTRYVGPHSVRSPTQLINHIFVGNTRVASLVNPDQGDAYEVEYVTDHLGSTSMLLNGAGGVEEWTALYPYGEPFAELTDGNGAGLSQRILYTGKEWDPETKFSYFGARYLDHKRGAWLSPDPDLKWLEQGSIGLNVYHYSRWNPTKYIDPDGREPTKSEAGTTTEMQQTLTTRYLKSADESGTAPLSAFGVRDGDSHAMMSFDGKGRYVYTKKAGWIDMRHFLTYAAIAQKLKENGNRDPISAALDVGVMQEVQDIFKPGGLASSFSYEDLPSDFHGAWFAVREFDPTKPFGPQVKAYLDKLGATKPEDAPNYSGLRPTPDDPPSDDIPRNFDVKPLPEHTEQGQAK